MNTLIIILELLLLFIGAFIVATQTPGRKLIVKMPSTSITWVYQIGITLFTIGTLLTTISVADAWQLNIWSGIVAATLISGAAYAAIRILITRTRQAANS